MNHLQAALAAERVADLHRSAARRALRPRLRSHGAVGLAPRR